MDRTPTFQLRGGQSTIVLIAAQTFVIDTYITNIYVRMVHYESTES